MFASNMFFTFGYKTLILNILEPITEMKHNLHKLIISLFIYSSTGWPKSKMLESPQITLVYN